MFSSPPAFGGDRQDVLPEQLELGAAEGDGRSVDVGGARGGVDVQFADLQVAAGRSPRAW